MHRLSLTVASLLCYIAIPVSIWHGLWQLSTNPLLALAFITGGTIINLALATVFNYVGRRIDAETAVNEKVSKPLTDLTNTPWEKQI